MSLNEMLTVEQSKLSKLIAKFNEVSNLLSELKIEISRHQGRVEILNELVLPSEGDAAEG